uniref:Isocitrate dehydrogenase [NAD] subunit gamma n=2 Tax=Hirondellea gigas TaxID=1518452 RepID=A0A6A7FXG5_9CRUS
MSRLSVNLLKSIYNRFAKPSKVSNVSHRQYYGTRLSEKSAEFPHAVYGGRHTVSLMAGDGIGPEMVNYVKEVFTTAGVPVEFENIKLDKLNNKQEDFHKALLSIRRNGVALKGSIESAYSDPLFTKSRNAMLRVELDLYANVIHCNSYKGVNSRYDIDTVIIRQNTEGEYAMKEHEIVPGVVESMKIITSLESVKLAHYAFNYATENNRKKITCVHKANIMKASDGLFLETMRNVAEEYPDIEFSDMIVDNMCMQLVSKPDQFDVIVAPNLYGLVCQNIVCGLAGGAGLYCGSNHGEKFSIFEPGTRNTASYLSHNVGNPVAMLSASVAMLNHLNLKTHADVIGSAIRKTISEDMIHTRDIGGSASSMDVVQNVIKHIKAHL